MAHWLERLTTIYVVPGSSINFFFIDILNCHFYVNIVIQFLTLLDVKNTKEFFQCTQSENHGDK